ALGEQAVLRAGDGAWLETKPASVVVHVRQAASTEGAGALKWLEPLARAVEGTHVKAGSAVLELFVRDGDKGRAMIELRGESEASAVVFVGDDLTDEEAFAALGPSDITIKVGDAPTLASYRLRDPDAVSEWLRELAVAFA
ncbi:MAG: trehalose-phosphatase, partial [Actinobacteria bacterium]